MNLKKFQLLEFDKGFQEDRQSTESGEVHHASDDGEDSQFFEGIGIQIDFRQTFIKSIETPQSESDRSDKSEG